MVKTYEEYKNLKQLPIPVTKNSKEKGSILSVLKVGFFNNEGELLPTVTIKNSEREELLRLPIELQAWAVNCVSLAQTGMKVFPSNVEFGILDGRYYAEIL